MSNFLNTREAAEFLRVSAGTLMVWRCTKRYALPFVKVGRAVRYRAREFCSGTAGLLPFISFSTSYLELDFTVGRRREGFKTVASVNGWTPTIPRRK